MTMYGDRHGIYTDTVGAGAKGGGRRHGIPASTQTGEMRD